MISGPSHKWSALTRKAVVNLPLALAESTRRTYKAMFRVFLAFCVFYHIQVNQVTADSILAYLQFLADNNVSSSALTNHLSALKTQFALYALNVVPFQDARLTYFTKARARLAPMKLSFKSIIDTPTLHSIIQQCDRIHMGYIFKAAILLSYFAFLRISNLVPHSIPTYNPLKQLARGDIFFFPPGAHVMLKWSKTLQMNNSVRILKIPTLYPSPLCPVTALKYMLKHTPSSTNAPLFQISNHGKWVPLTDSRLRKNFTLILTKLSLQNSKITFHSLRRSGATLAFNSKVPIQDIQSHGTWTSDCVWSYITQNHQASDRVALTFQSLLRP